MKIVSNVPIFNSKHSCIFGWDVDIMRYLNQARVEKAKIYLRRINEPITAVFSSVLNILGFMVAYRILRKPLIYKELCFRNLLSPLRK